MRNQEKSVFKQLLPHLIAIVCFLAVTFIYFSPLLEGKSLPQSDVQHYSGVAHELSEYYYKDGQSSAWTGSVFSGMPAYQIGVWGGPPNFLNYVETPLKALGGNSAGAMFTAMLMAYILFCLMGIRFVPAVLGAIAYAFSSYNIIIIGEGHVTKAWTIAYMPLVVSALVSAFKKKYMLAGLLMALGLAMQIKNNHLQVTYYTGLLCVFIYIGLVINSFREKDISGLLKSSGAMALGVVIAILCNVSNIYSNYEMGEESIRGKSELTQSSENEKESSGVDKEYAFRWSYGKSETLSLLIPNIHGGVSKPYDNQSESFKILYKYYQNKQLSEKDFQYLYGYGTEYWGDQPFTKGPVYFGAIICFLFILGMILIKNPVKWVLLAATIFFIFLAWGRNLEGFNDWFFYHFPFYNKFRAVSQALVIPALTMLIVAVWGIQEFFKENADKKKILQALYISGGITGGLCLLLYIAPGTFFNFAGVNDEQAGLTVLSDYYQALLVQRKEMLTADALRSFVFIGLAFAVLALFVRMKGDRNKLAAYGSVALLVLIVIDLWGVDKRYLNNDKFETKTVYNPNNPFALKNADKAILQDKHPSYRVLELGDPFNNARTSYYHKSIGGYHAAKLRRYQELISYRIMNEIKTIYDSFQTQNVDSIIASFESNKTLNMLNAKYVIFDLEQAPLLNPYAMGNAWFVSDYSFVENADQEIAALNTIDPAITAVLDKKFEPELSGLNIVPDSTATIELVEYKPNKLKYNASVKSEQLAVFSEIYYANGWKAFIDGKPASHFRADWTLRAMRIPAGNHEIEFEFIPETYNTARNVTSASSGLLVLALVVGIGLSIYRKKNKEEYSGKDISKK